MKELKERLEYGAMIGIITSTAYVCLTFAIVAVFDTLPTLVSPYCEEINWGRYRHHALCAGGIFLIALIISILPLDWDNIEEKIDKLVDSRYFWWSLYTFWIVGLILLMFGAYQKYYCL